MLLFNLLYKLFRYSLIHISIHLMLLFNNGVKRNGAKRCCISIHLMLLFNLLSVVCVVTLVYFNTSNVTIQQLRVIHVAGLIKISIHLMLLFNSHIHQQGYLCIHISIHLMLLFNGIMTFIIVIFISIHLMLLFNYRQTFTSSNRLRFQYI